MPTTLKVKIVIAGLFIILISAVAFFVIIAFLRVNILQTAQSTRTTNPNLKQTIYQSPSLKNTYESANYIINTDIGESKAKTYLEFFEGFRGYFSRNFFTISNKGRLQIYIFSNLNDFNKFKTADSEYGYYNLQPKEIISYSDAGFGTFAHELVHSFIDQENYRVPDWLQEGFPAMFEKIYGYYESGKMLACTGYPNPWRFEEFKKDIAASGSTPKIIDIIHHQSSKDTEQIFASFLWQSGYFNKYLILTASKRNVFESEETTLNKATGLTTDQLEKSWKGWVNNLNASQEISNLPGSAIQSNKQEFNKWLGILRLRSCVPI
ncbi:MAG: hypothetical protein NT141_04525 [candidate division WWE3 bacterium]|nr:hypothetical protein [candidate division WWE3 bacterium]